MRRRSPRLAHFSCVYVLACTLQPADGLYSVSERTARPDGFDLTLSLGKEELAELGASIPRLSVKGRSELGGRLHVKITDADNLARWEVPESLIRPEGERADEETDMYSYMYPAVGEPFYFVAGHKGKAPLFDSRGMNFRFKDQYLEFSSRLSPNRLRYGLGESSRTSLQLQPGQTYTLWNRDFFASEFDTNLYGSHPFVMEVDPGDQGRSAAIFLLNSNGMDVTLTEDTITFKVLGGVLDLYFLFGNTPQEVLAEYGRVIGRPVKPPYWALGFHNCRWGYKSVKELRAVVENYTAAGIPLDGAWTDIDYMDGFRDFTLDPSVFPGAEMAAYVRWVHEGGRRVVLITDPGIKVEDGYAAYEQGMREGVFLRGVDGSPYLGAVWPGPCVYPDFLHPRSVEWWTEQYREFYKLVDYDGSWIDMPSNFCAGQVCKLGSCPESGCELCCSTPEPANRHDCPPYSCGSAPLGEKTVPMSAMHFDGTLQYNTHNLYGALMARATYQALLSVRGKRPFVLTRSTFAGTGKFAAHWTGDNAATWRDLQASVRTLLTFSILGMPMVGADIGGFLGNVTEELCTRWVQLGAFYPFARVHNDLNSAPQELYRWPSVAAVARQVLQARYALLPYLDTAFHLSTSSMEAVARPLWWNFPADPEAHKVEAQFMLGEALLITPVLEKGKREVAGYFPSGGWYGFFDAAADVAGPERSTLKAQINTTHVHIRGGCVVPMQVPGLTTEASRRNPLHLLVALLRGQGTAKGLLAVDQGEQIDPAEVTVLRFEASKGVLRSRVESHRYDTGRLHVEKVVVMGLEAPISVIAVNGKKVSEQQWRYSADTARLTVEGLQLPLNSPFEVSWASVGQHVEDSYVAQERM